MCRNIKVLFHFDPPATDEEIHDAALQYVRKLTGFNKPSSINDTAFQSAIDNISNETRLLFNSLTTNTEYRNRNEEKAKSILRNQKRFGVK